MLNLVKDVFMWIILMLTIIIMTIVVWPVFFLVNIKEIAKRELMIILALIFLVIDQLSKFIVIKHLIKGNTIPILKNYFHITYVQNTGAAFGLFQNKLFLFIGVAILSVFVIIYYSRYLAPGNKWVQVALAFLLSGALGNMIDRISYGYVIDFIDFRFWPVFNFADIVINIGVGMLLVEMFWETRTEDEEEMIIS